ncbi:metallophosphoesterase [Chitinibacter tainanensis]|uniref:metallophosphoesterase n=1 Tax=Chitinibacter tainanensis TaxID=230667 RepID=UPI002353742E|nr:metallophosphoesterase [Chitinibacter tainanensis]
MKLWILSDLHIDIYPYEAEVADADLVILAGDLAEGTRGLKWLKENFKYIPVLYVPGNHEYYGSNLATIDSELQQQARPPIYVLQRQSVVIGDVRFLGCTLWTDFSLFGLAKCGAAKLLAQRAMADFRYISKSTEYGVQLFTPSDSVKVHELDYAWLQQALAEPFEGKTVVITHHAPAVGSLHPRYQHDLLSSAFISDLSDLMGLSVLWVHGHTHHSFDYILNATRIVCNPRGYASHEGRENPHFNDALVIEI